MKGAIVLVCLGLGAAAFADAAGDARAHFDRGTAHYALGEFAQAAEEYQEAYRLKQDSALLYNAAQAYRLAGNAEKAFILYRNYVLLYPNEPNVGEVREQIVKLKEAIAVSEKAKMAPPTGTNEPKQLPPPVSAPVESTPTQASAPSPPTVATAAAPQPALAVVAQPAPRPTPVYKKWWLWTAVGVVVAGAVVAGVVVGTQSSSSWSTVGAIGPGAH